MCGRFASYFETETLVDAFDVDHVRDLAVPSWNVAPTANVQMVAQTADAGRELRCARWGLVPSWSRDITGSARLINARSETVTVKPSFRSAAKRRRALIPAAGYFEWQRNGGPARPFYLHPEQEEPMAFAGLYEWWRDKSDPDAEPLVSCTIITRAATDSLGAIHDRMPLVIPPDLYGNWLDRALEDPRAVESLINSVPDPVLIPREIGRAVGSVRNNYPELLDPVIFAEPEDA